MKIHFIAIGGSAMHNLAIALRNKGYTITGSDDEIFEPSKSRLAKYNILPENIGWYPQKIDNSIDAIILGMHAKENNTELIKAKELGLKIYSYPEFLYQQSKNKIRIVVGGSHGKTTITAMILHVLNYYKVDFDYMVGSQLEGFDVMVKLSDSAKYIVLEGDEYLTSPIDKRPKFHLYKPNIALLSGIAWDHFNVFPSFENYLLQFEKFIEIIEKEGSLTYCQDDWNVKNISEKSNINNLFPYTLPKYKIIEGKTNIVFEDKLFELKIFGKHNLLNMEGARNICNQLNINNQQFYTAIQSFGGASKRLEKVAENENSIIYKDFAHSPSKLKATIESVREQYPNKKLIACIELHTYSSLNAKFLEQYKNTMNDADIAIVYFSKHALELKNLPNLDTEDINKNFNRGDILVFNDNSIFRKFLENLKMDDTILLLMSSGNFEGLNIEELAKKIIHENNIEIKS